MTDMDDKWKRYELLLGNFQGIAKSQAFFVNSLAAFLCLVWAVDVLHQTGGITIQALGASAEIKGFWSVVPIISCVISLALIGSINLIIHAWRRLDLCVTQLFSGTDFFFTDFDVHKNILDYLAALTARLKKPIMPDTAEAAKIDSQKWKIFLLLYPGLILFSIYTTSFAAGRVPWSWPSFSMILLSTLLQVIFSLPFIFRKVCIFLGVHKGYGDGIEWGDAAFYSMPIGNLKRIIEKLNRQ